MIYEKFGIKVSLLTVLRLLKKHNFKLLKSGSLPAKAEPKKQRTFYQEVLLALMEKAKNGTINILCLATHYGHRDFVGHQIHG
jgi:hypothetical protein